MVKIKKPTKKGKYRSTLEAWVALLLVRKKVLPIKYETITIPYIQPEMKRKYTPDFILPNGIMIEVKGKFTREDRKKHLWIKEQHPELDIRFLFQACDNKIHKDSDTTYASWCDKYGFKCVGLKGKQINNVKYLIGDIPSSWLK